MITLSSTLQIPEEEYANQGNAILGIRDSGKSYTGTWFAERLLDAGIPFVAFDPIGVWRSLKLPGTGAGYPVVVAGEDADLPLTPESAPQIVRAAMAENIPLVLDLYSMGLSKADWKRIVESCVSILLYENKRHGLRHVFIEEASEFAPQRVGPDVGRVYAVMEKLARMGGNAGLGYTLINQRAEEVNKAVLELCDCLFLHRQKGKNSLVSLGKWLDAADAKGGREITRSLPSLPQGECWVWAQGRHDPERVRIPAKRSLHPNRRDLAATSAAQKRSADVSGFVERLVATAGVSDKADMAQPGTKMSPLTDQRAKEYVAEIERLKSECERSHFSYVWLRSSLERIADSLNAALEQDTYQEHLRHTAAPNASTSPVEPPPRSREPVLKAASTDTKLPRAVLAILAVLKAHHPKPRSRESVALQAGYTAKGGGFQNSLSLGRTAGLIEGSATLSITPAGLSAAGDVAPLPVGKALVDYWSGRLPLAERKILEVVTESPRRAFARDYIALRAGYTASGGGFQNALSRLRTLGLVEGSKQIRAAEEFFSGSKR